MCGRSEGSCASRSALDRVDADQRRAEDVAEVTVAAEQHHLIGDLSGRD
jgi:hypothetical protein